MRLLIFLFLMIGSICYGLDYKNTCNAIDPDDLSRGYKREIKNPDNYTVSFGYISDLSITPKLIGVTFSDNACSSTKVTQYFANEYDDPSIDTNINVVNRQFKYLLKGGVYYRMLSMTNTTRIFSAKFFIQPNRTLSIDNGVSTGDPFNGNTLHQISNVNGQLFFGTEDSPCDVKYPNHPDNYSVSEFGSDLGCLIQLKANDKDGGSHEFSFRLKITKCTEDFNNVQTSCMQTVPLMDSKGITTNVVVKSNFFQFDFYNADTDEKL